MDNGTTGLRVSGTLEYRLDRLFEWFMEDGGLSPFTARVLDGLFAEFMEPTIVEVVWDRTMDSAGNRMLGLPPQIWLSIGYLIEDLSSVVRIGSVQDDGGRFHGVTTIPRKAIQRMDVLRGYRVLMGGTTWRSAG